MAIKRPNSIVIFGKVYSVEYADKPSDVDVFKRESIWGQVDHWTHSMRVYAPDGFEGGEIWDTLLHEILHVIIEAMEINIENEEKIVKLLALSLSDVLIRNQWLPELKEDL